MREIELKPSRRLGLLLLGMAALALLAIHLAALPGTVQVALAVAVMVLSGWSWRQMLSSEKLRIAADGRLQCRDGADAWQDVEVLGDSFVSTHWIVLRYRMGGGQVRTLTLLPDSADAEALRRLRVSLRWARHTRSDIGTPDAG